ncbi:30S ribosomal protein S15 [Candidatus Pacearchaeota archaeon]|nr:30S ribosomal protein S15 [Candidatus Pacearchaeota archaeon]
MAKTKDLKQKYPKPVWLKLTEDELVKLIADLSEKHQPAQIGLILRDQYGVPTTKVYGKKLGEYLKEVGKPTNADLKNVEKKVEKMQEHLKNNKQDKKSKHKLQKAQSKLIALTKYSSKRNKK